MAVDGDLAEGSDSPTTAAVARAAAAATAAAALAAGGGAGAGGGGGSEVIDLLDDDDDDLSADDSSDDGKSSEEEEESDDEGLVHGGNLVVCPTTVLHQWAAEIRSKVSPRVGLTVHVYHGKGAVRCSAMPCAAVRSRLPALPAHGVSGCPAPSANELSLIR